MALYPNTKLGNQYTGEVGKTHTNLVVSEGNAPAEVFIVSETNTADKFIYEYGPEGNQVVDLAKGKIIEAVGNEYDRETGYNRTAIREAQEDSVAVIGVNHHNVYEVKRGEMGGSGATVITRNVIEVPLFEAGTIELAKSASKAMKFGSAYGVTGELKAGEYVVSGANGNFKVLDAEKHDHRHVVGQVMGVTRDLAPQGFLQYFMDIDNKEYDEYIKSISNAPTPGGDGFPYGAPYSNKGWKKDFEKLLGVETEKGIPFLTDGFFRAEERIDVTSAKADENLETIVANDVVTLTEAGAITVVEDKDTEGAVFLKLAHKLNERKLDEIKVVVTQTVDGADKVVELKRRDIHLDVANNTVIVYLAPGEYKDLTATVEAIVNPIAGIPTEWDYKGSVGAVRILLQK